MGKRIFSYQLIIFCVFLFFSCTDDDKSTANQTEIPVKISAHIDNTYFIESEAHKPAFEKDDLIGLYLVDYTNNQPTTIGSINNFMNTQYIYTGSYWRSNEGDNIFLTDNNTTSDLYAYWPYDYEMSRTASKRNLIIYPFDVETDQSISTRKSDFLWAKYNLLTATNANAKLIFEHTLSRIIVNISFNNTEIGNSLNIHNLKKGGLIDMNTGNVTPNGKEYIFTPFLEPITNQGYDATYSVIVIPQSVTKGTSLFSVEVGKQILTFQIDTDLTFERGKAYTFNLIVGEAKSSTRAKSLKYSTSLQCVSHY